MDVTDINHAPTRKFSLSTITIDSTSSIQPHRYLAAGYMTSDARWRIIS